MWLLFMMHWTSLYSTGHTGPRPGLGFSRHRIWGTRPLLVTTGGHHWRPFQHYSLDLTVQGPPLVLPWGQSDWQADKTENVTMPQLVGGNDLWTQNLRSKDSFDFSWFLPQAFYLYRLLPKLIPTQKKKRGVEFGLEMMFKGPVVFTRRVMHFVMISRSEKSWNTSLYTVGRIPTKWHTKKALVFFSFDFRWLWCVNFVSIKIRTCFNFCDN